MELLASEDAGAVLRVIAGQVGEHAGPGSTFTPITYAHASVAAGARLRVPWRPDFNALVYVLAGNGSVGSERRPDPRGPARDLRRRRCARGARLERTGLPLPALEVLLLGGRPIGEPVAWYGPFVMNTKQEIVEAIDDYQAGRMGSIPAETLDDAD